MGRWRRTTACERAAQWISLDLDGELNELEQAALARHLKRCSGCLALQAEIGGFTQLLRAAPLAAPAKPVEVAVPRSPRVQVLRRAAATLALAAALTAVLFGLVLPLRSSPASLDGLSALSTNERVAFASVENARTDGQMFNLSETLPRSFAARVLV